MIYAGIDYSLNCPCICVYDDTLGCLHHNTCKYYFQQYHISNKNKNKWFKLNFKNIFPSEQYKWNDNYHRFLVLADYFLSIIIQYDVSIVAIEDYSLGSQGKIFNIAECTSILKYFLMLCNIKLYAFPPTHIKKIFSGKGNANKELMGSSYKEKYDVDMSKVFETDGLWSSPISDIVDSHAAIYTYFNNNENNENFLLF